MSCIDIETRIHIVSCQYGKSPWPREKKEEIKLPPFGTYTQKGEGGETPVGETDSCGCIHLSSSHLISSIKSPSHRRIEPQNSTSRRLFNNSLKFCWVKFSFFKKKKKKSLNQNGEGNPTRISVIFFLIIHRHRIGRQSSQTRRKRIGQSRTSWNSNVFE